MSRLNSHFFSTSPHQDHWFIIILSGRCTNCICQPEKTSLFGRIGDSIYKICICLAKPLPYPVNSSFFFFCFFFSQFFPPLAFFLCMFLYILLILFEFNDLIPFLVHESPVSTPDRLNVRTHLSGWQTGVHLPGGQSVVVAKVAVGLFHFSFFPHLFVTTEPPYDRFDAGSFYWPLKNCISGDCMAAVLLILLPIVCPSVKNTWRWKCHRNSPSPCTLSSCERTSVCVVKYD